MPKPTSRGTPSKRDLKARENLKKKVQKTIIIYGAPCNKSTGNSKLIYHMAKSFQIGGHKVFTIGLEYNNPQINYDNIPILPGFFCEICGRAHKGSEANVQKIAEYINLFQPDFFICVGDPYQFQQFGIGNLSFEDMKNTHAVMYATIDAEGLFCNEGEKVQGHQDYLMKCDKIIGTAKFTQEQLKYWDIDSDMIYETIDLQNYSPISKEKKTELRKKYRFKENDFIIYNSGRNIMRKRLFTLLDGCVKFLCDTKDTYLLLNCPNYASDAVYPDTLNPKDFISRVLKKKYGRDMLDEGRIVFLESKGLGSIKIGEKENAELYQIADIYATATGGEGFGLCPIESQACGIPVIVPDNSTGAETIGVTSEDKLTESGFRFGKGGLLVNTPIELYVDWGLKQDLTNSENIHRAIDFLYKDPELRKNLGESGRKLTEKLFNFEDFKNKWLDVIKNTQKKEIKKQEFGVIEIEGKEKKGDERNDGKIASK